MPQLGDADAGVVVRERREEVERQSDADEERIDKDDREPSGARLGVGTEAAVDSEASLVHQARFRAEEVENVG